MQISVDPDYRSPSIILLSAFLMPRSFASCSSRSGKGEKNRGEEGANQLRGRYLARSKERGEGRFLFDPSSLPRLVGEGTVVVDEGGVVARDMVGSEEDLEVGDFLLDGGGIGVGSADESWMPYLLCNMDSAAA